MRARDYLEQVKKIDKMIINKRIEIEQWKGIAESTGTFSDGERVQSSGNQQKMADAIARYVDIEKELEKDIEKLIRTRADVIHSIEMLPVSEYDVLHKIYIGILKVDGSCEKVHYLTYDEISDMKGISYSSVRKIHGKALRMLQEILDERIDEN